jgi:hypothetical protein
MSEIHCPACKSDNISTAEQEFKTEYSFLTVLAAVFFLIIIMGVLFFVIQLHPVIIILLGIALVTKGLGWLRRPSGGTECAEMICLHCRHRFSVEKRMDDSQE